MQITRDEAARIARLAQLRFDEKSLDQIATEMTSILGYIDQLSQVGTGDLDTTEQSLALPMRDDIITPSIARQSVQTNAPQFKDGFFVVPRVVGSE